MSGVPTTPRQRLTMEVALPAVLDVLHGLSPSRWAAVRALLELVVKRPDLADDAQGELLHLLATRQTARRRVKAAAVYTLPCRRRRKSVPALETDGTTRGQVLQLRPPQAHSEVAQ